MVVYCRTDQRNIPIPDNGRDVSNSPTVVWTSPSVEVGCVCIVVVSVTGKGEVITSS